MGFGKYLVGGAVAVGAIIAAPVIVPAAGVTAGLAAVAGTGAVGTIGAAGAAVGIGAYQEKRVDDARYEGEQSGYVKASREYESKFEQQADDFIEYKKNCERDKEEYNALIRDMENYIKILEQRLSKEKTNTTVANELSYAVDKLEKLKMLRSA